MKAWLSRNTRPISLVVLASAVVIGVFELIDQLTASTPVEETAGDELVGIASLAGLIKVALFLGVGALVARGLRRRFAEVEQPTSA